VGNGALDEEAFETGGLAGDAREFLEAAIADYNAMFGTSFDTSADRFENYYKDLSQRLKQREIDLVIVVNMFLTGFDATTLNTLWVDKNLRMHGLLQAFSRTNRILNSVKAYGNIISFRNLEQATNDAIALFGNRDARGTVLLRPYKEYASEYEEKVAELQERFPLGEQIISENAQKDFITLFGSILKLQNILLAFDEFAGSDPLSERDHQDYRSIYLNLYAQYRQGQEIDKEAINDDIVFEIELVKQIEVNVDYILMLVEEYRKKRGWGDDKDLKANIFRAVDAAPTLRNKRDLIEDFVESVSVHGDVGEEWTRFIGKRQAEELEEIIASEGLRSDEAREFVARAFRDGGIQGTGTAITDVLPPTSRFTPAGNHQEKKSRVLARLGEFFERFSGLVQGPVDS
jgi:type I restriction enzyme R subunit